MKLEKKGDNYYLSLFLPGIATLLSKEQVEELHTITAFVLDMSNETMCEDTTTLKEEIVKLLIKFWEQRIHGGSRHACGITDDDRFTPEKIAGEIMDLVNGVEKDIPHSFECRLSRAEGTYEGLQRAIGDTNDRIRTLEQSHAISKNSMDFQDQCLGNEIKCIDKALQETKTLHIQRMNRIDENWRKAMDRIDYLEGRLHGNREPLELRIAALEQVNEMKKPFEEEFAKKLILHDEAINTAPLLLFDPIKRIKALEGELARIRKAFKDE